MSDFNLHESCECDNGDHKPHLPKCPFAAIARLHESLVNLLVEVHGVAYGGSISALVDLVAAGIVNPLKAGKAGKIST